MWMTKTRVCVLFRTFPLSRLVTLSGGLTKMSFQKNCQFITSILRGPFIKKGHLKRANYQNTNHKDYLKEIHKEK